jgi:tetratricopeptide (TPR) repeat protein
VALAYCNTEKYQKEYQNIVWVTLTQSLKESIINTFIDSDIDFKYNEKEDTDKNFNHLLNTLRNITGNNLLVLDNANNDKEIIENKQSLEDTNWKILLTTRCLLEYEYTIKVDNLSEEDAVRVYFQYCKVEDIETLKKLLKHIDYHTLLTELLAKTLKRSPLLDINKLYEIINNQDISAPRIKKEIPIGSHAEYRRAAKKEEELYTYILGIFEIENMSEKENEYLRYFSILPSVEISIIDLYKYFGISDEREIEFEKTLNSLVQKGWIQENNKSYKMHQLIQTVIKEKLQPDAVNCKDIINSFVKLLKYKSIENPLSRKELLTFAENIWNSIHNGRKEQNIVTNDLATLANNLAEIIRYLGNYEKAWEYQNMAILINNKVNEHDNSVLALYYNNMAIIFKNLGIYYKSLEYHLKSIRIQEDIIKEDSPSLASSYNNIGIIYRYLGDYKTSLDFLLKALKIRKKIFNDNHPDLAHSYHCIAITYRYLKNYHNSLKFNLKSIKIRENILDKDHPDLAVTYCNIAMTYSDLKNYAKSLEFNIKSINIKEKILDNKHPDLATSYHNIAILYFNLINYNNAKYYIDKAVEICTKSLPENHPHLKDSLYWQKIINDALNNQ